MAHLQVALALVATCAVLGKSLFSKPPPRKPENSENILEMQCCLCGDIDERLSGEPGLICTLYNKKCILMNSRLLKKVE